MREEDKRTVRQSLLLANCPDDLSDRLLKRAIVKNVPQGTTLFEQGDQARFVYIVLDGWIKLFRITISGSEAVVGVFTKGRSFGEAVAFRNDVYPGRCGSCHRLQADPNSRHRHARPHA